MGKEEETKKFERVVIEPKKKSVKIVVWIFMILIIIAIGVVTHRFIIFTKIHEASNEYLDRDNYYYCVNNTGETSNKSEIWFKNGKYKVTMGNGYIWGNLETKEEYLINDTNKVAIDLKEYTFFRKGILINTPSIIWSGFDTWYHCLQMATMPIVSVQTEIYDGKECYVLNGYKEKTWINKENYLPIIRIQYEAIKNSNGKISDEVNVYTYENGVVSNKDVEKPQLSNYTMKK